MIAEATGCGCALVCVFYAAECAGCGIENGAILHDVKKPEELKASVLSSCGGCGAALTLERGKAVIDEDEVEEGRTPHGE